jgi:hypothetical protein
VKIRLIRPAAQHTAGTVLDRRPSEASALVRSGVAEYVVEEQPADTEQADSGHASDPDDTPEVHTDSTDDSVVTVTTTGGPIEQTDLDGWSLAELRARATDLGLPTYGTKAQLAERIMKSDTKS